MGTARLAAVVKSAAFAAAVFAGACRMVAPTEQVEFEGSSLLGFRHQSGWENEDVPMLRFDGSMRPWSWPVGLRASTSLSGYTGDQTGEQSLDFGLGLARSFELMPERLFGSLGLGHLWITTDNGELFISEMDSWQANYVEAGLSLALGASGAIRLGIEARYSIGDGPDLGFSQPEGEFLDLYVFLSLGLPGEPAAHTTP